MKAEFFEYIHHQHLPFFVEAAQHYQCHILVRKTGRAALSWVGKRGYTGKRADMKGKTSDQNAGRYQIAGLVCSPYLQPFGFSGGRLAKAHKEWAKCTYLVTQPRNPAGFEDDWQPTGCRTPYLLQTNPDHKHYGCVALVEFGLLLPRYVHGDYDLYAIIPAGKAFDPNRQEIRKSFLGSTMMPESLGLEARLRLSVPNLEGPLAFRVANFINNRIDQHGSDLLGALMVNHGEQINLGREGQTFEPVLAVMPRQENGEWAKILGTQAEHEAFYRNA